MYSYGERNLEHPDIEEPVPKRYHCPMCNNEIQADNKLYLRNDIVMGCNHCMEETEVYEYYETS